MVISRREMFGSLPAVAFSDQAARNQPDGGTVLSGADFGFRIDRIGRDGVPVGAFVVRVGGKWVEPQLQSGIRKAT